VIISGAGMAAALPGVIAAEVTCPVIGVPCADNFDGLDSMLSTLNMPPGIPVLTTGVECAEEAARAAVKIVSAKGKIFVNIRIKYAEKAADTLSQMDIPYELSYNLQDEGVNIKFVELDDIKKQQESDKLIIYCPIVDKSTAKDSMKLLDIRHGLWVSLNRADNAAIAATQILKSKLIEKTRKEFAAAVLATDEAERNAN
jgi:phosphoribosylcarboxyaminoimidazole (NCAIR) mutase